MSVVDVCAQVGLRKAPPQQSYNAFQHYLKLHKGFPDPRASPEPSTSSSPSPSSKAWNTYAQHEWETTKKKIANFYPEEAEEAQCAFEQILECVMGCSQAGSIKVCCHSHCMSCSGLDVHLVRKAT